MKQLILPEFPKYEDIVDKIIEAAHARTAYYAEDINPKFIHGAVICFDDDRVLTGRVYFFYSDLTVEVKIKSPDGVASKSEYMECISQLKNVYSSSIDSLYMEV